MIHIRVSHTLIVSLVLLATIMVALPLHVVRSSAQTTYTAYARDEHPADQTAPAALVTIRPTIVSSFSAPSNIRGLTWGDNSLWLVDDNQNIYRMDTAGNIQATLTTSIYAEDLAWYENNLWATDGYNNIYQLGASGQVLTTLDIGTRSIEWAEDHLYIAGNYAIAKYDRYGTQLLSWEPFILGSLDGLAYDGRGLWIGGACTGENRLYRYSLMGELQATIELDAAGIVCDYNSDYTLAWDGTYLWYGDKLTVYQLDIAGLFEPAVTLPANISDSSASWGDYDNDGDLDILLTGLTNTNAVARIYRNDGASSFSAISANLAGVHSGSADWGDYDHDGDLDIILAGCIDKDCSNRITRIYRNDGNGTFTNIITPLPGVASGDVAWGDYDNDGDLDIVLTGSTGSAYITRLYRNDGRDTFTARTELPSLYASKVKWGDYDSDGDLDFLLVGCYTATCYQTSAYVMRNDGNETFHGLSTGLDGVRNGAIDWGDYDNDGDLDILLTGSNGWAAYETSITKVYQNDAGVFRDIQAAIAGTVYSSAAWGDYDNDGDLDILLAGITESFSGSPVGAVYRNDGNNNFVDSNMPIPAVMSGSVAWGDYDNDGDLDILITGSGVAEIYRNDVTQANSVPTAPTNLRSSLDGANVLLQWDAASDQQTPANGLTYNVRVGTTPGASDVVAAMSIASTGNRTIIRSGNAYHRTMTSISGLISGKTYYWSVQAIDTAMAASPFAVEENFAFTFANNTPRTIFLPLIVRPIPPTPTRTPTVGSGSSGGSRPPGGSGCVWGYTCDAFGQCSCISRPFGMTSELNNADATDNAQLSNTIPMSLTSAYLPLIIKPVPPPPTATPTNTPTPTSTPRPTRTPVPVPYDGSWSGTTSQGKPVTFTVASNAVTRYYIEYDVGSCLVEFGFSSYVFITNNVFSDSDSFFDGSSYTFTGNFNSNTTASGTFTANEVGCGNTTITWNATKSSTSLAATPQPAAPASEQEERVTKRRVE